MSSPEEDADVCECVVNGHHDADDSECLAELRRENGSVVCTRPAGHDGSHSACNVQQHPITVWDQEADA